MSASERYPSGEGRSATLLPPGVPLFARRWFSVLATAAALTLTACGGAGSDVQPPTDPTPPQPEPEAEGTWAGAMGSLGADSVAIPISLSEAAGVVQESGVLPLTFHRR